MAVNNSIIKREPQKTGITAFLNQDAVRKQIDSVLGGDNAKRFVASVVSAVTVNPALQECTNQSIFSGALLGESLNLSPSPQLGHFYLVPYENKGIKTAQFQMGYKGFIQLAIRSGQYKNINVIAVKEGEVKEINYITEEVKLDIIKDYNKREEAKTVGYLAYFELINGFRKTIYWTKEQMQAHAVKYSKGYASDLKNGNKYTFWSKDFDSMAYKTMLRQIISKWGIMSIEMQKAFRNDMAEIQENGEPNYIDSTMTEVKEPQQEVQTVVDDPQAALFN